MPAQYALRPVRLTDLPTLKRWRSLPDVQKHLRHPHTSWLTHLRWWWGIRAHQHPTRRVWAVTWNGKLCGQAGLYYRTGAAAEVSILLVAQFPDRERDWSVAGRPVVEGPLATEAKAWGLTCLWAEVLSTAPLARHTLFPPESVIWADHYSTLYRWRI